MKFKLAVPNNVLTRHEINLIEARLAEMLLGVVVKNFPDWKERSETQAISGGEIILQEADMVRPMKGLNPGIHLTISLISFKVGRNFDGLAADVIQLIKDTQDNDRFFMSDVNVFVQMTLDCPVVNTGGQGAYSTYAVSGNGVSLLEYSR